MATSRRIFITGATGGIGELVVHALAARGDAVLAHARDRAALEKLVGDVRGKGGEITPFSADLSSLADARTLADEVQASGDIDVLVNNAAVGFGRDKTLRETTRDGHEMRFGVNYLVPFLLTELAHRAAGEDAGGGARRVDRAGAARRERSAERARLRGPPRLPAEQAGADHGRLRARPPRQYARVRRGSSGHLAGDQDGHRGEAQARWARRRTAASR